ncbi:MAG: DegT/DnrJ/EryC1/StrS family aminotransferase [Nitrospirae bacterium]|nr:DegT/DnrJ/EryC1/StrS family aminotransferase [Nitrospirota bacterium]
MIRIVSPMLGEEELAAVRHVFATGFLTQGDEVSRFEEMLATSAGAPHVVVVSSGTAALHLALLSLGIGPGDEVITSAFTFPATVNTIELVGACPILVDIELSTFNLDTAHLERIITPRTKAIIPVHEFGLMADMDAIRQVASRFGLLVIEDAACALGASQSIQGSKIPAGLIGDIGCFSFHPRKSITTAEGGCLMTKDSVLAQRLRLLRSHGMTVVDGEPDLITPGLNYRITEMQAAMGSAQLGRFAWMLSERRKLAGRYGEQLAHINWIQCPQEPEGKTHAYQSYVIVLAEDVHRGEVIKELRESGIEAVRGAYAVHKLHYYRERYGYSDDMYPAAKIAHDRALALPLYPGMPDGAIERVGKCLSRINP